MVYTKQNLKQDITAVAIVIGIMITGILIVNLLGV